MASVNWDPQFVNMSSTAVCGLSCFFFIRQQLPVSKVGRDSRSCVGGGGEGNISPLKNGLFGVLWSPENIISFIVRREYFYCSEYLVLDF